MLMSLAIMSVFRGVIVTFTRFYNSFKIRVCFFMFLVLLKYNIGICGLLKLFVSYNL